MTNIILADKNGLEREGIASLLENISGYRVIAQCSNGRDVVKEVSRLRPQIALLDLILPELNGIDAARQIGRLRTGTRVILMITHPGDVSLAEMIEAGISGCFVKSGSVEELEDAVRNPAGSMLGASGLPGERFSPSIAPGRHSNTLTNREREILQLVGEGNSTKQIAEKLRIASTTVKTHRDHIMEKLDAHDIAGLTRASIRLRLVSPEYRVTRNYLQA